MDTNESISLSHHADVRLVIEETDIHVSSTLLSNASEKFHQLFQQRFDERGSLEPYEFRLDGETLWSMKTLLTALHHRDEDEHVVLTGSQLVKLADDANRWQLVDGLRANSYLWQANAEPPSNNFEWGCIFAASLLFKTPRIKQSIAPQLIQQLSGDFAHVWTSDDILNRAIGLHTINTTAMRVGICKDEIKSAILLAILKLRMTDLPIAYGHCSCGLPYIIGNANDCICCGQQRGYATCSNLSRVQGIQDALANKGLWPEFPAEKSVGELIYLVREALLSMRHVCGYGAGCPLGGELHNLIVTIDRIAANIENFEL